MLKGLRLGALAFQVVPWVKNPACNGGGAGDTCSFPGLGRSPGWRVWEPTLVFLPGESHGQRSLAG